MSDYVPERLDMLAVAVIGQAYKDMVYDRDTITHQSVSPKIRYEARRWWKCEGRSWAELLSSVEIPEPEAWDRRPMAWRR